jgi:hypothetical protein
MNKKFASLGTALSRDEAKKVMGGLEDNELGGRCRQIFLPCSVGCGSYCRCNTIFNMCETGSNGPVEPIIHL